jgi:hypothetical protein
VYQTWTSFSSRFDDALQSSKRLLEEARSDHFEE